MNATRIIGHGQEAVALISLKLNMTGEVRREKKLQRGEAAGWVDGRTAAVAMVSRDGHYLCVVRS